ncbi:metal-dependent phosphohydrolase [Phytomonospora sp. NPDC050363]|uniref:metal-dependent phosphohydrolase n=1 Tax=Phytomonospora sp. NPDC050363 TaxID=3155642 RepID=UPI0033D5C494
MSVLRYPRPPIVQAAMDLARPWCEGQIIDAAPAYAHAVKVALMLDKHIRPHPDWLTAAALLHDAPEYAPPDVDLDTVVSDACGPETIRVVRALADLHAAMGRGGPPDLDAVDEPVLYAAAADKLVALTSILRRAKASGNPRAFFAERTAFRRAVPYFRAFVTHAQPRLPTTMATNLDTLVTASEALSGGAELGLRIDGDRPPA